MSRFLLMVAVSAMMIEIQETKDVGLFFGRAAVLVVAAASIAAILPSRIVAARGEERRAVRSLPTRPRTHTEHHEGKVATVSTFSFPCTSASAQELIGGICKEVVARR